MDSVRVSNTSLHGGLNETTPFLDSLASESARYETAIAPGSWSLPSHTSIFTGLSVAEHGITGASKKLKSGNTVFSELSDTGYDTGMFSENTWITEMDVGLKDEFDTVEGARNLPYTEALDPSNFVLTEGQGNYLGYLRRCLEHDHPLKSMINGVVTKLAWDYPQYLPSSLKASTPAEVYVDLFLDWMADRSGPWAACINLMDGHMPYEPSTEHDLWGGSSLRSIQNRSEDQVWEYLGGHRPWWEKEALASLYDGTIRQMDTEIRRLIERLRAAGEYEETLVVITSDHGEGFGERSVIKPDTRLAGHGKDVHEAILHVPLLAKFPCQTDGTCVTEPATLARFPAAVRSAIDGDWSHEEFVPDGPVVASTHGLDEPSRALAKRYCGGTDPYGGVARTVYERVDGEVVQYQQWEDRSATVRVINAHTTYVTDHDDAGVVEAAFADLSDAEVGIDSVDGLDVEGATEQRLKDLGYM